MSEQHNRRTVSKEEFLEAVVPVEEFELENPNKPGDIIVHTARRLSPGHLILLGETALIRPSFEPSESENGEKTEEKKALSFEKTMENIERGAKVTSLSIVDPETHEPIYTKENCLLFPIEFNSRILNWALFGRRPNQKTGGEAEAAARFPDGDRKPKKPENS